MKMSAPNRESIMKMAKDLVSVKPDAVNPFTNENSWQYKAWAEGAAMARNASATSVPRLYPGAAINAAHPYQHLAEDMAKVSFARVVRHAPVVVPTPVAEHIRRLMADANTCADPMRAGRLKRKAFILTARHTTI
jgi:hypothetical protein